MTSHLTPEQRADKNGRVVTRHIRSNPVEPNAMSPAIPAPAGTPMPKRSKPTERQLERHKGWVYRESYSPDPKLCQVLETVIGDAFYDLDCNDVELFDVLSVVSPDNAVALVDGEVTSADEALGILDAHGLNRLCEDRREMMNEAMNRRIDPRSIIGLHSEFPIEDYPADNFLNAAQLLKTSPTPSLRASYKISFLYEALLKDEISFQDISKMGVGFIEKNEYRAQQIHERLKDFHRGTAPQGYDPRLLTQIIEKTSTDPLSFSRVEMMIHEHGAEYVRDIDALSHAARTDELLSNLDAEYRRKIIDYQQALGPWKMGLNSFEAGMLYDAGIAPEHSIGLLERKMSVHQIIDAHESGVNKSISGGWL